MEGNILTVPHSSLPVMHGNLSKKENLYDLNGQPFTYTYYLIHIVVLRIIINNPIMCVHSINNYIKALQWLQWRVLLFTCKCMVPELIAIVIV